MQKTRFIQNVTIIALGVAIIIMSVGYAAYQQTLTVTGTAEVEAANWNVHFGTPVEVTKDATPMGDNENVIITAEDTEVTFKVKLALGESYEVNIPVLNEGTFDAELASFTLTGKKDGAAVTIADGASSWEGDVLKYTATLGGAAVATKATTSDLVKETGEKTLNVKIDTFEPETEDLLADNTGIEYEFKLVLNYSQKTA